MRRHGPIRVGERVTWRRKLQPGMPTEGRVKAIDYDFVGDRCAIVVWDCGVYAAGEQAVLTSDLKRVPR